MNRHVTVMRILQKHYLQSCHSGRKSYIKSTEILQGELSLKINCYCEAEKTDNSSSKLYFSLLLLCVFT